jgi:putative sterol carrier protein
VPDRTVACSIPDLATSFSGEFRGGELFGLTEGVPDRGAQIVLIVDSDDLVALADGSLSAGAAWASGRLKVDASLFDLLRLRTIV